MEKGYIKLEKKKGNKWSMVGLLVYVCLSAMGLTLIKIGTSRDCTLAFTNKSFSMEMNYVLIVGMIIYVASFLTSMVVMKGMNLSVFYPLSAGLIYIVVCVVSFFVLKEKISMTQLIGMAIILAGIIVMNIDKGK